MTLPSKTDFVLDPSIHFLNHGSFGACPRPVFESYQRWQAELERQPVAFLGRRATELLAASRAALAAYLGADADDLVYFPNPTTAINMVARNVVRLAAGGPRRASLGRAPRLSEAPVLEIPGAPAVARALADLTRLASRRSSLPSSAHRRNRRRRARP